MIDESDSCGEESIDDVLGEDSDTDDDTVGYKESHLLQEVKKDDQIVENILFAKGIPTEQQYHSLLKLQFQDVSAMYSDGVPFLVDCDTLIITCMADTNWCNQLGGSILHLIYLIESHLNIFASRAGVFHLVFFDVWHNIFKQFPIELSLYRQIIINHFSRNTDYPVHIFKDCYDDAFMKLLSTVRSHFFLTNLNMIQNCMKISKQYFSEVVNIYWSTIYYCLSVDLPIVDNSCLKTDVFIIKCFYVFGTPSIQKIVKKYDVHFRKFMKIPTFTISKVDPKPIVHLKIKDARLFINIFAANIFYNLPEQNVQTLKILMLKAALMDVLHIENRCCPKFKNHHTDLLNVKNTWHECLLRAICSIKECNLDWTSICDQWQGLLFGLLCDWLIDGVKDASELGTPLAEKYESIISLLQRTGLQVDPYPISSSHLNGSKSNCMKATSVINVPTNLLHIENPLALEFCKSIMHTMLWETPPDHLMLSKEYTEDHHYHSMKMITDEYDRVKDNVNKIPTTLYEKRKYQRNQASQAKYMTLYGSSIEGRILQSRSVVRTHKIDNKEKKTKISKKAQAIIDSNIKKKLLVQEIQENSLFTDFKSQIKNLTATAEKLSITNIFVNKITTPNILYKVLMCKVKIILEFHKGNKTLNLEQKRNLFLTIRKVLALCSKNEIPIKSKEIDVLTSGLIVLNCEEIARRNGLLLKNEEDSNDDLWIQYQLKYLGSDLERPVLGLPDVRAHGFIPDDWQRKLFDIVDKRQSAIIVAPTSSGKTYASYYCMESVIREGTEGIVIYVAPTKALVNQVAATVYARFKDTCMSPGESVYGVFTRDYKLNTCHCQILVTVPECLEILLLSPRLYNWVERIRYVIFDEVHCIAGNIGGIIWERCLLLIRCPFLALSATIRYPEQLLSWLQDSESYKQTRDTEYSVRRKKYSHRVHLVVYSERHTDLTRHSYEDQQLHHLHPYAHLEVDVMKLHNGIPKHVNCSPAETLQLYEAMKRVNPFSVELQSLSPNVFFSEDPKNGFITRDHVNKFNKLLSDLLTKWYNEHTEDFIKTISLLKANSVTSVGLGKQDTTYILDNIVDLILTLKKGNMLPAIIFTYDRSLIELMLKFVVKHFKTNDIELVIRRSEIKREKKEKKRIMAENIQKNDQPKKIVTESRILNVKKNHLQGVGSVDSDDIKYIERRIMRYESAKGLFVQGLSYGVCMHHGGLNNVRRSTVEMLFRMKVLNVVFATGTLAMGIHMPCKTVVVVGNSPYLDSLQYHQMSGRAGRRGYDTQGNVIFFGINNRKQHTLLTAHLPSIQGVFPLTVSHILRLLLLASDVTDKGKPSEEATKITVSRIMALLENSLVFKNKPQMKDQIKHFFGFSLQLLILQNYINGLGEPLKWCGLATHLHYHEPGNLAFIYLLKTGVIREICKGRDCKLIQYNLVVILSYLFTKIPLKVTSSEQTFNNSTVCLDPLPSQVIHALENYNAQVDFIYNMYFINVARQVRDVNLPLSNIEISSTKVVPNINDSDDCLHNRIMNFCAPKIICSSFAALSGNDDNNLGNNNIISNAKKNICTDMKIVPTIDLTAQLNGYALDFYRHGIISAIQKDNGLNAGEEFNLLKDFMLVLKTIKVCLEEMQVIDKNDPVLKNFTQLSDKYTNLFVKSFPDYKY